VVVAHREPLVAEGLTIALRRFAGLLPVASTSSAADVARRRAEFHAIAIDRDLPGAGKVVAELLRSGVRVVYLGAPPDSPEEEGGVFVPLDATVETLASALVPGAVDPRSRQAGSLTAREREILVLVARGMSGRQVARHLGISPKTVERHKTKIHVKLAVPNQAAAVSVAVTAGLIGRETWN
jgi:DNA-binding NarL/FixJ family response regulator